MSNPMSQTSHYALLLPDYTDAADIPAIYNENMQKIDAAVYALQNWGSANKNKFLVVGNDGTVGPVTVPQANGGTY